MSAPAAFCPTDIPVPRAPIAPLPPAMWTRTRSALQSPIFRRWVVLSILLHVLVILLFGSPVGGQKEGRAMFGRLSVVIKEGWRDTGPDLRIEREMAPRPATPPEPEARRKQAPRVPPVDAPPASPADIAPIVPPTAPALMERVAAPTVERPLAEAPPAPAPVTAPAPAPVPTPPPMLERLYAPRMEQSLIEAPPTPPAPLERLPAPRIERQMVEPPPLPAPPAAAPAPPAAAPAPPAAAPAPPAATATRPAEAPAATPQPTPSPGTTPAPETRPDITRPNITRPAPGDSPFRRAQPEAPSARGTATAPPALDMDAMRKRAGELGRAGTGNRAALPFPMPPVPEKKSKMEELIDKARKPDCRDAYKHLGLAAVVPLIANEFGEGKCKW